MGLYDPINSFIYDQLGRPGYGQTAGGISTISTAPPKYTPAQRLQKLQSWFGNGTTFNWTAGPTPTTRGVFPTWLHVKSWYDNVLGHGYDIEDIGFSWEELHPLWAKYARETFPAIYANYNKLYPNDYPME